MSRSPGIIFTEMKLSRSLDSSINTEWPLLQGLNQTCPREARAGGPHLHLLGAVGSVSGDALAHSAHPDTHYRTKWVLHIHPSVSYCTAVQKIKINLKKIFFSH